MRDYLHSAPRPWPRLVEFLFFASSLSVAWFALATPSEADWMPGFGRPGVNGTVRAYTEWNGQLVAAGFFQSVGNTLANNVARWDGTSWQALGDGLDGSVNTVTVWNGQLVAAGSFTASGERTIYAIAAFDGAEWQPIGQVDSGRGVDAIALGDDLIVTGTLEVDGLGLVSIARWDGKSWTKIDDGSNAAPAVLAHFEGDLVAGGRFQALEGGRDWGVARWNGAQWDLLGSQFNLEVRDVAVFDGQLYAGGRFTRSGSATLGHVARWDGAVWVALGPGLDDDVQALSTWNGQLIATGSFANAGTQAVTAIASWNGSTWSPFGAGLRDACSAAIDFQGQLHAGGAFWASHDVAMAGMARWDGTAWQPLAPGNGIDGYVYNVFPYEDKLIVSGQFRAAGTKLINDLAVWDGTGWGAMGKLPSESWEPGIRSIVVYRGDLIAAGAFREPDQPMQGLLRWDGDQWVPFAGAPEGNVRAVMVHGDDLVVAGQFEQPGCGLVRWDGAAWHTYPGFETCPFWYPSLYSLGEHEGDLIVGGSFLDALDPVGIARWDGADWHGLGRGIGGLVRAIVAYQGDLYACGHFVFADGIPARHVVRWDGTRWNWLDHGVTNGTLVTVVEALLVYQDQIVVAGDFHRAGPLDVRDLAAWDGSGWHTLGSGGMHSIGRPSGRTWTLAEFQGKLVAGGGFYGAGDVASSGIAFFDSGVNEIDAPSPPAIGNEVRVVSGNPVRGRVEFALPSSGPGAISITLFDAAGRAVRRFRDESTGEGEYAWTWDLRDGDGREVPAGIYFLRSRAESPSGDVKGSARVVVIR